MRLSAKNYEKISSDITTIAKDPYQYEGHVHGASVSAVLQRQNKLYIESYGCQMNFSDSEIVVSILKENDYVLINTFEEADLILINTCSIREKAEQTVRSRLSQFQKAKRRKPSMLIGVLGCMAERLKRRLLEEEKIVDLVVGPDAYRTLPQLVAQARGGMRSVNVLLSREETYADIAPVRLGGDGVSAFVSIMRGCDNMCSFCVVPFTRGRERSRNPHTIVQECSELIKQGYREVTLLGQNVDSFRYRNEQNGELTNFAQLLAMVALVNPLLRVRFSTSHPKDITEDVLWIIKRYDNVCQYIHLPVQSGSSRILALMNRTYTREWYIEKVRTIRRIVPNCTISTDIIVGFCTETEEDHQATLSLMDTCQLDYAYMFMYSEREGTPAAKKWKDDVSDEVKKRRLQEVIEKQRLNSFHSMQKGIGKTFKVLIEGDSKRGKDKWKGRNEQNQVAVFPKEDRGLSKGDYAYVSVLSSSAATHQAIVV